MSHRRLREPQPPRMRAPVAPVLLALRPREAEIRSSSGGATLARQRRGWGTNNHRMREQQTARDAARWARRRLGLCVERVVAGRSRRVGADRGARLQCASLQEQLVGFRPLSDPGYSEAT